MKTMIDLHGFWEYVSNLDWWQGLITIFVVLVTIALGNFWKNIIAWIGKMISGVSTDTLQYRMFWGLMNDAFLGIVKNEIRKSLKENGFEDLSDTEFDVYIKNKGELINSMIRDHIINLYPPANNRLIVSQEVVLKCLESNKVLIYDKIEDIYLEARKLKKQENEKKFDIETKFVNEINDFVNNEKNNKNCTSCLLVLFGKREIVEQKIDSINILKNQMNFAEQRLSELLSIFLSFYSDKIQDSQKSILRIK
jgi:hypothetical protein